MNYWITLGAPREKLVVGMGTYGRGFTLSSTTNTGVGASTTGNSAPYTYTKESGFLAYYEVGYTAINSAYFKKFGNINRTYKLLH